MLHISDSAIIKSYDVAKWRIGIVITSSDVQKKSGFTHTRNTP
jgi:hypothetical protein